MIEDEKELALAMASGLRGQGFEVDLANNADSGMLFLDLNDYDALTLDLNLPDGDGMDLLDRLRKRSDLPVLIVTARDQINSRTSGLNRGADDYIIKPFDMLELGSRIRAVVRRSYGRSREDMDINGLVVNPSKRTVSYKGQPLRLSAKEYTILECLCFHHPDYVSAETILSYAYDDTIDPFSSVIRVHFSNMRKKLPPQITIESMKGKGYRLCVE